MNPFEIAGDVVASQDLRSSEFEVQQVTSSPASRLSAGGFTDTWNDCSHLSSFCSSGVIQARSENRTLEGERNALSQATAAQTQEVEKEKGTAERLRGGGVEGEDSKEGRNFRRFSFTAPPEHAPPYQRPHPADYPTEERPSGSFVGVGSLPGKNEEAGVALVPDELPEAKKERPYVVLPSGFASGMPLKKGKGHTVRKASGTSLKSQLPTKEKPEARGMSVLEMIHVHFEEGDHHVIPKIDMPSKEELSGSYCGVGSLPGKRREPAVALFPVERKHHLDNEVDVSQLLPSMETPSISYGGVGSLPGKKDEAGVALLPEERRHAEVEILAPPVPRIPAGHKKIPRTPSGAHRHVGAEPAAHGHHASHKERVAEAHAKAVESRHWAGMGNQPHGAAKLRYVGMRTTLTGEEMYQAKFASGIDNRSMAKVDLPSTEEPSLSRCGVGSLPGKTGEEGVAIFPYERPRHMDNEIAVEEFMPTTEVITISYGGVGSLPGKRSEQRVALTPEERLHPEGTAKVELPSTEEPSLSRCGVGSLPGKTGEEGVAIFPYERPRHMDNEIAVEEFMPTTEVITISYGGVGSLPGKRSEQRVALAPEERLHPAVGILMSHLPPRADQLPSTEHPSGSLVGVGSLPGQRNEKAVALTPEERHHPEEQILASHRKRGQHGAGHRGSRKAHGQKGSEGITSQHPEHPRPQGPSHRAEGQVDQEGQSFREGLISRPESEHVRVGASVGGMGSKARERFGWEHPGGPAAMQRVHSNLSPTAPEFVPHWSGGMMYLSHMGQGQEQGDQASATVGDDFGSDIMSEDDEEALEKVHQAERRLQQAREEEERAGVRIVYSPIGTQTEPTEEEKREMEAQERKNLKERKKRMEEEEKEAIERGEERAEMMRKTMKRVGSDVRGAVEGVREGVEGVTHMVWGKMRWEEKPGQDGGGVASTLASQAHEAEDAAKGMMAGASKKVGGEYMHLRRPQSDEVQGRLNDRTPTNAPPMSGTTGVSAGRPEHGKGSARALHFDTSAGKSTIPSNLRREYVRSEREDAQAEARLVDGEDGSTYPQHHERHGVLRGAEGVEFTMDSGEWGVLPGYPTQAGMSKLMQDRMLEDQMRRAKTMGHDGVETTTNTMKQISHLETDSQPSAADLLGMKDPSRADLDDLDSNLAVHGSSSDLGSGDQGLEDRFSGKHTPVAMGEGARKGLSINDLGPVVEVRQYEVHEHQHGASKGIN